MSRLKHDDGYLLGADGGAGYSHTSSSPSPLFPAVPFESLLEDFTQPFFLVPAGSVCIRETCPNLSHTRRHTHSTNTCTQAVTGAAYTDKPFDISFSSATDGSTLLHVLCRYSHTLHTYTLSTTISPTKSVSDNTPEDLDMSEDKDISVHSTYTTTSHKHPSTHTTSPRSPTKPDTSIDTSDRIPPVRVIDNVASVTHIVLGRQSFVRHGGRAAAASAALYGTVWVDERVSGWCVL